MAGGSNVGQGLTANNIAQYGFTLVLAVTGFLMQTRFTDVTEELKGIASSLRTIEDRNYKLSERASLMELRVSEVEKRLQTISVDKVGRLENKTSE